MSKIINRSLFLMLFVFVAYSQITSSVFAESIENPVTPVIVANDDIYNQTPETYGYNFVTDQDNALNFSSTIFLQNDVYIDGDLKGLIPEDADVEILSQSDICPLQDYGSLSGHPTYLDRKPGFRFNCTIAGTYTFTYKIIYNGVESNVATVTILVKKINHSPEVFDGDGIVLNPKDTLNLMTYATDTDLDALDFIIINSPTHGKLSGTSSTTNPFIYTPDVGYLGDDSFSFKAFDGFLTSPTSTISLSIIIPELKTATETEEIPPVTIFSGGGGGGGGSSGGGSFVIPNPNLNISTSTKPMGKVLGASIDLSATSTDDTCGNYLSPDTVIGPGLKNNKNQVILLQRFLNRELNLKLPLLGFYGRATQAAVKTFQLKYRKDILDPWGIVDPTPYVYSTTVAKINSLVCPAMKSSLEDLKLIPINLSTPAN